MTLSNLLVKETVLWYVNNMPFYLQMSKNITQQRDI